MFHYGNIAKRVDKVRSRSRKAHNSSVSVSVSTTDGLKQSDTFVDWGCLKIYCQLLLMSKKCLQLIYSLTGQCQYVVPNEMNLLKREPQLFPTSFLAFCLLPFLQSNLIVTAIQTN